MKKVRNLVIGGIQQKIFNLVLVTILLMMAAYAVVIIYQSGRLSTIAGETNELQRQSISEISQGTMDAVLDASFTDSTRMQAYIADDFFGDAAGVVRMLADYAEHLFADPDAYGLRAVALPDKDLDGEVSVQLLTESGTDLTDPDLRTKLGLIGNMGDMMTALYRTVHVDSCYIALPEGVMLLADDHAASKFDENGRATGRSDGTEVSTSSPAPQSDVTRACRIDFDGEGNTVKTYEPNKSGQSTSLSTFDLPSGSMSYNDNNNLFTLQKLTPKKVTMRVWLEGEDPECDNDIQRANLQIKLSFVGIRNGSNTPR